MCQIVRRDCASSDLKNSFFFTRSCPSEQSTSERSHVLQCYIWLGMWMRACITQTIYTQYGSLYEIRQLSLCPRMYVTQIDSFNRNCGLNDQLFIIHSGQQRENERTYMLLLFQQQTVPTWKMALGMLQNWSRGLIKTPVMCAIGHSHEHGRHHIQQ